MKRTNLLLFFILMFMTACNAPDKVGSETKSQVDEKATPDYYMGFSDFPYEATIEGVTYVRDFINTNGNMVSLHFDNGVPWSGIINKDLTYDKYISEMKNKKKDYSNLKVLVSVTPIDTSRHGIAFDTSEKPFLHDFDEPIVYETYIAYLSRIIEDINPDYLCYSIESNLLYKNNPDAFYNFIEFSGKIYQTLKDEYPSLTVFHSIQIEEYYNDKANQNEVIEQIIEQSDLLALSSYPFMIYPYDESSMDDVFETIEALAGEKSIAFTETGNNSTVLSIGDKVELAGSDELQQVYLSKLLKFMKKENKEFVIWYLVRDYDRLWESHYEGMVDDVFRAWLHSGLIDSEGNPKDALEQWREEFQITR